MPARIYRGNQHSKTASELFLVISAQCFTLSIIMNVVLISEGGGGSGRGGVMYQCCLLAEYVNNVFHLSVTHHVHDYGSGL